MTDNILDTSKKLYDQILNSKFDVEEYGKVLEQLTELLTPLNIEIDDLSNRLNKLNNIKNQVVKYKDDTKNRIVMEVNLINQKMKHITESIPDSDNESDDESDHENNDSWVNVAKHAQPETSKTVKRFDNIKITSHTSINALSCSSVNVLNAPVGNLLWLVDKNQFAIKILVGDKPVVFEGNIGNIYVRGDAVCNVDICRQSKIGRSCLKSECTFRHEPPKKGEIRHYFSAPTYYPPRMASLAKELKGVHRIGSRENLDEDLERIRANESSYEYNAYIAQSFHSFLVSLVMERGLSS